MHPPELLALKVEMEFGVAPVGDTIPLARTNADGQPRLLVSRFDGGTVVWFREDVPAATRSALSALGPERLFDDEQAVVAVLGRDAPVDKTYRLRWYVFSSAPDPSTFPDVTVQDGRHVILVDGEVVSWAETDTEFDRAVEVSIETLKPHRGRGYALQVTSSWAAEALRSGRVAFYSHVTDNVASAAVARRLGLTHLSDEVEYF